MNVVSADTLAGVRSLPTKPPDIVNEFGFSSGQERVSFRDKILGIQTPSSMRERVNLITDDSVFQELCYLWYDSLIIKLIGENIGYY
ncbi:hypothetical protein NC651_003648 [Populus alba x Populus x berolinensis]|nr:hypothetical protein NC651_003648 [Populus alba x Populus x berolinensis]